MSEPWSSPLPRLLQTGAYIVVVAWGIAAAAPLITTLLLALVLAYCVLPLPTWMMRRFGLAKGGAIAVTVALAGLTYLLLSVYLVITGYRLMARLPVYEERLVALYDSATPFLAAHGIRASSLLSGTAFSPDRIIGFARVLIPAALGSVSSGALISLLSLLFLLQLSEPPARQTRVVAALSYYGSDVQRFVAVSAKTGAVAALVNLVLLMAIGVDFPLLWCVLYFFLQFIPSIGSFLALVSPALLAFLMLGWERALIVAAGMILASQVASNVLNPILMKDTAKISFLEMVLSIVIWGTLLGFWGSVLAIPLTLVLKKFAETSLHLGDMSNCGSPSD